MRAMWTAMLSAGLFAGGGAGAQAPAGPPPVPTTKVLAIGHITVERSALLPVMQQEVRETVKLYLGGKIDQWYVRQDSKGVVFIMNVTTVDEAHALLEALPLGHKKFMEFELIPLGPLSPLARLLMEPPAAPVKP